jgi:hypothetical protein
MPLIRLIRNIWFIVTSTFVCFLIAAGHGVLVGTLGALAGAFVATVFIAVTWQSYKQEMAHLATQPPIDVPASIIKTALGLAAFTIFMIGGVWVVVMILRARLGTH